MQKSSNPLPLDWDDLRFVLALERAGSLSAGARAMGIDYSTAFRRINAIEARLGARLFERARSGYSATEAGEAAAALAGDIEKRIDDLAHRLAGSDLSPTGTVRLTTTDTLVPTVAPLIAAFRGRHPGIVVELVASNHFLTLTRRDADIALRFASVVPDHLVARRIGDMATALYVARSKGRQSRSAKPLAQQDWLAPEDSLSHLASSRWIAKEIPADKIVARADSMASLAALCRQGLGVAPLPCVVGDRDPVLHRIGPPMPELATGLWLITHPDLRRTLRVKALFDHLAAELSGMRAVFTGTDA